MYKDNRVPIYYEEDRGILDAESERIIHRFLTKQMICILRLLRTGGMSNKEIAEEMGSSSNALSNILHRMKKCEVKLLLTERKEKYIIYSLTPIAREYVEKVLSSERKNVLKIVQIHENETIELLNCQNSLEKLKEKLGDEWIVEFPRCCFLRYENDERGELQEADTFFEAVEELIIKGQYIQLESILHRLGDECSKRTCQRYVAKFKAIRWLCDLERQNCKLVCRLIDDIFVNEKACISCEFLEQSKELSTEDIVNISKTIFEIAVYSKRKELTKEGFLKRWGKYFREHEMLAYYLAEKYITQKYK